MCVFGPDRFGNLSEETVTEEEAWMCENCKCRPVQISCLLGPDKSGHFYLTETSYEYAEQCASTTCVCTT